MSVSERRALLVNPVQARAQYGALLSRKNAIEREACYKRVSICAGCVLFFVGSCCGLGVISGQSYKGHSWCENSCAGKCCESTDYYLSGEQLVERGTIQNNLNSFQRRAEVSSTLANTAFNKQGGPAQFSLTGHVLEYLGEPPTDQAMT